VRKYLFLSILLLILLILPLLVGHYVLGVFILIFYYAYLGQCWNILTGYTGYISLGHGIFLGIGAYTTAYLFLAYGVTPWFGMLLGGVFAAAVGLFMGYLGFRFGLRGVYFVLLTIAFAELGKLITLHMKVLGSFTGLFIPFSPSFSNLQFRGNLPYYYLALGLMLFSLLVVRVIERSRFGCYFVSIREDEEAAESLGVNAFYCKMISIGISGFLTALGGTFYTNYIYYIHPNSVFGTIPSIEIILRPIVGGMGTLFGPIIGSFVLTPLAELSRTYFAKGGYEGLHLIIYGLVMIFVVLFMPKGIISYVERFLNPILKNSDKED
jgi:branched-chain amino acid transport system permease protein